MCYTVTPELGALLGKTSKRWQSGDLSQLAKSVLATSLFNRACNINPSCVPVTAGIAKVTNVAGLVSQKHPNVVFPPLIYISLISLHEYLPPHTLRNNAQRLHCVPSSPATPLTLECCLVPNVAFRVSCRHQTRADKDTCSCCCFPRLTEPYISARHAPSAGCCVLLPIHYYHLHWPLRLFYFGALARSCLPSTAQLKVLE